MTFLTKYPCALTASLWLVCVSQAGAGEAPPEDRLPPEYAKYLAAENGDSAGQSRGAYSKASLWPADYSTLRVCFFEGSEDARALIAEFASGWTRPGIGITLDFGEPGRWHSCGDGPESQIRISFDQPGYWSAMGADSVTFFLQQQPSMNFSGFDRLTPDNWSDVHKRMVRHEFGHALGLADEDRSPASICETEYDWDNIYRIFGGIEIGKQWADELLRKESAEPGVTADTFDPKSIMMRAFPIEYYLKGAESVCFAALGRAELSAGDHALVAKLYPVAR
jgi:hypothetical protein